MGSCKIIFIHIIGISNYAAFILRHNVCQKSYAKWWSAWVWKSDSSTYFGIIKSSNYTMNAIGDEPASSNRQSTGNRKDFPNESHFCLQAREIANERVFQRSKAVQRSQIVTKIKQINSDFSLDCLLFRGTIQNYRSVQSIVFVARILILTLRLNVRVKKPLSDRRG